MKQKVNKLSNKAEINKSKLCNKILSQCCKYAGHYGPNSAIVQLRVN